MESKERNKSGESEERDQSMGRSRISNTGTGVDIPEMNFDGKINVHGQHRQFIMMKEK